MSNGSNSNQGIGQWIVLGVMAVAIGGGTALTDVELALTLHNDLLTNTEDDWDTAKEHIFNDIDDDGGTIRCVYSNTNVALVDDRGVLRPDSNAGVQVEHTWASKADWVGHQYHFERDSIPGADLHHLFAVRRGINSSRGNKRFGFLPPDARELHIDADGTLNNDGGGVASGSQRDPNGQGVTVFQPRPDHRGNVARSMFYMSVRYWMPLSNDMEAALRDWHVEDPVDANEQARNNRVQNVQGNRNPFIDDPALVEQIDDY